MNTRRGGALVPGLLLIALGVWFLADSLGLRLPGLGDLWPLFPLGFGLAFLVQYFAGGRQDDGLIFTGVTGALIGAFFLTITLGPLGWGDLGRLWPVFPLIGGAAFLAQWLVKPRDRGLLAPAALGLAVGLVGLLFTLQLLGPAVAEQAARLWPVVLILLGLGLLLSYLMGNRRTPQ
ncbi:MAG: hypothetical protein IT318_16975 [Anaerolineales bacterium]|nr:hypothetical protein [Anaerolineales bacterium]